jgi:hypothetical protein
VRSGGYPGDGSAAALPESAVVDDLLHVQSQFDDAERHARTDVLDALLAEDFRSIGEQGYVLDKAQWIARHGEFRYVGLEVSDTELARYDGAAIVRRIQRSHAIWQGRPMSLRTRVSHVWVGRPGAWQLAAVQFSSLPDETVAT